MTKIKKWCALVLSVMLVITAGIVSVNAADADATTEEVGAASAETGITIHYQNSELAQPYVYLWNSLQQTAQCQIHIRVKNDCLFKRLVYLCNQRCYSCKYDFYR